MEARKSKKTEADLHCHITDGYDIIWKGWGKIFGRGKYYGLFQPEGNIPEIVFDRCIRRALNNEVNTLVGLANFDDERAQRMIYDLRRLFDSKGLNFDYDGVLLSAKVDERNIGFLRAQEIITDKGDILLIGLDGTLRDKSLAEVIAKAKGEYNALVFGCHIGKPRSLRLGDVEKYREYFDGVDVINDFGIPVYSASDSHTPEGIFRASSIFENLDFSNAEKIKEGIRRNLRQGVKMSGRKESALEVARHLASCAPWFVCDIVNHTPLRALSPMKRDYQ
jgi:hypothetical protein